MELHVEQTMGEKGDQQPQGLDLGALVHLWAPHSGLLLPPSPPHCRGSEWPPLCLWRPNHQHLPQTSSLIGNRCSCSGSSSIHSSGEQSVPFFFSAKATFPLSLSAPSTAKPAAKARFLLFFIFMVPFIYGLCFLLALTPLQKGREERGGEQHHISDFIQMLSRQPLKQTACTPVCLGLNLPAPTPYEN